MLAFYFQLFWLPTLLAAALTIGIWTHEGLSRRAALCAGWCSAAALLQYFAPVSGAWALGLLMQTALAIVLLLRRQLG